LVSQALDEGATSLQVYLSGAVDIAKVTASFGTYQKKVAVMWAKVMVKYSTLTDETQMLAFAALRAMFKLGNSETFEFAVKVSTIGTYFLFRKRVLNSLRSPNQEEAASK